MYVRKFPSSTPHEFHHTTVLQTLHTTKYAATLHESENMYNLATTQGTCRKFLWAHATGRKSIDIVLDFLEIDKLILDMYKYIVYK